ncbi:intracellular protein transport protein USO1 [Thalassophryne amazonica]|uniref:intracellular protein transport protein USO1 n=1 Tax=Thalassophryne amazonica TaxID=390379 RepID=UPI001471BD02|nr:intracellular protein transport protein USO1 [Thalassophryne amazonica]
MGTQGTGRKRSTKTDKTTAEDDALNLIAREAEARLAAKRAARAEAREIRMKELERQQKEIFQVQKKYYGLNTKIDDRADSKWGDIEQWMLSDDDERMSVGNRGSIRVEDRDYLEKGSRAASVLTAGTLTSLGGTSSRRGSGDTAITLDTEASIREIKVSQQSSSVRSCLRGCRRLAPLTAEGCKQPWDPEGQQDGWASAGREGAEGCPCSAPRNPSAQEGGLVWDVIVCFCCVSAAQLTMSSVLHDSQSSRLSDDSRASRASRLALQPASYASSDLYSLTDLSSARVPSSALNGFQLHCLFQFSRSHCQTIQQLCLRPLDFSSYRSSGSRASSRASSARASPVGNCGSVASFLRSAASNSGLPRDVDDVVIPDFSNVEDRDYLEKGSRAASVLTAGTLTSLGGTSSRRGSGDTAITLDTEASIREIKEIHELKDQIQDVEAKYTQNLKEVKDTLAEVEEKYRKAMVSNAQLDNEKNNLMYQVDTLKDSLMELEELLSESRRQYEEKLKEHDREKHAHSTLQFQFNEMKETLKQSEELLNEIRQLRTKQDGFVREILDLQETVEWKDKKIGALERQKEYTDAIRNERDELREEVVKLKDILKKHGIVLGPDLNINGEIGETEVGESSGDSALQLAQVSQTSPVEGNSMLGNTPEAHLRTSIKEEVDPEQHQGILEEAKENHLSSDRLCKDADLSSTETSRGQQSCSPTVENGGEDGEFSKAFKVEMNEIPNADYQNDTVCSPEPPDTVVTSEENTVGSEKPEAKVLGQQSTSYLDQLETKAVSVDTHIDGTVETKSNIFEEQETRAEVVDESNLISTDPCPQEDFGGNDLKESSPDDLPSGVANTEHEQEPENTETAENDEAGKVSSKAQAHGAKRKKKKKKGKKKAGIQQQKDADEQSRTQKGNKKTEDLASALRGSGPPAESEVIGSASGTPEELMIDEEELDKQQVLEGAEGDAETLKLTQTFTQIETLMELRMDPKEDPDKDKSLETKNIEQLESVVSPDTEANLSMSHLVEHSDGTERIDAHDGESTSCLDNLSPNGDVHAESGMKHEDECADDVKFECTSISPEGSYEVTNISAEAQVPVNDRSTDRSERSSESQDNMLGAPSSTSTCSDGLENTIETPPESEKTLSATEVSDGQCNEVTEMVQEEEEEGPEPEMEQGSLSPSIISSAHDDPSELQLVRTQEELNREMKECENLTEPLQTQDEMSDGASLVRLSDTIVGETCVDTPRQDEHMDDGESHIMKTSESQSNESSAESLLENGEKNIAEMLILEDSKEVPEADLFIEQSQSHENESRNDQNGPESKTTRCPVEEELNESREENSANDDSLQGVQENGNRDESVGEEQLSLMKRTDACVSENRLAEHSTDGENVNFMTSESVDQCDKLSPETSLEMEESSVEVLKTSDLNEVSGCGLSEQDQSSEEATRTSQNVPPSETFLCALTEQVHEHDEDDSPQPAQQDSDRDEGVGEEGSTLMKQTDVCGAENRLETKAQAERDKLSPEASLDIEEHGIEGLKTSECDVTEQDQSNEEGTSTVSQSGTFLCPLAESVHERDEDASKNDSFQAVQKDSHKEQEKEEGLCLDFNDQVMKHTNNNLETVTEAEDLDDGEYNRWKISKAADQSHELNAGFSLGIREDNVVEVLNPQEHSSFTEQKQSIEEGDERNNGGKDQESEMCFCPSAEQLPESGEEKSENSGSSLPVHQHSDEEEDDYDDDEGQSFDFDDMDLEAAIVMDVCDTQEEAEKEVEIVVSGSNMASNEESESELQTPEESEEVNDEKCAVEGNKVDHEMCGVHQEELNSLAHEEGEEAKAPTGEEAKAPTAVEICGSEEPGQNLGDKSLNVEELGVVDRSSVDNVNQVSIEEEPGAVKQEVHREDSVAQKSENQTGLSKVPPQSGKDAKKNIKKGKGKDECKMSYLPPPSLHPPGSSHPEIRLRKLVDEREKMIEQVKKLKSQLELKSQRNGTDGSSGPDGETLANGPDSNVIEVQRDSSRQISDLKFKLVKAEQEVTALEQNVTRLEGQVIRYKSAAENSEKVEDELKAEKRRLQRELRSALDKVDELESNNSHLSKRLEKMKTTRGMAQTP